VNLGAVLVLGALAVKFMEKQPTTTTTKPTNGVYGGFSFGDPGLDPKLRHL